MHKKIFPARLEHLYDILNFIQEYGQKKIKDSNLLNKIIVAVEEAVVNIINYGYPEENGTIEITCEDPPNKPGIRIHIKDQGIPFNPVEQTCPKKISAKTTLEEIKLGGYGIYIFVGIMDQVEYKRLDEGNILTLVKYF